MSFEGQVVLVTGASRGIGRATAVAFAQAGATVAVNYRVDQAGAESTRAEIVRNGGKAVPWRADLGNTTALEEMVNGIEAETGPIAVLVNNAAAFNNDPFLDVSLDEFDRLWATNGRGLFYLSQLVASHMTKRKSGSIIHVSSILARQAMPGRAAYIASKGAVESLTRAMALDLAPYHIRVNVVAPGLVKTKALVSAINNPHLEEELQSAIPWNRFGEPRELAETILFLASPAASYITGAVIPVDGGLSILEAGT